MTSDILSLDPNNIHIWEYKRSATRVLSIYDAIRLDQEITPIEVKEVDGEYIVAATKAGADRGGHHRLFAHWLARQEISAELVESERNDPLIIKAEDGSIIPGSRKQFKSFAEMEGYNPFPEILLPFLKQTNRRKIIALPEFRDMLDEYIEKKGLYR